MPIELTPTTLRLIIIPANTLVLIGILVTTLIPYLTIPGNSFVPFVFWLYKPALLIEIVLSCTVLVMGYTGSTKFNSCWQGSYSFFLLMLASIAALSYYFCINITGALDYVIPQIISQGVYTDEVASIKTELNCSDWSTNGSVVGCRDKISAVIGSYPTKASRYIMSSLCILGLYFVLNVVLFFLVSESDSAAAPEKMEDD